MAASSSGAKAYSSVFALADSGKRIIQIVQLLEEMRMSFSFCLNKHELLLLSGFGLLFQGLDLKEDGKLIWDNQSLVCSVIAILGRNVGPGAIESKWLACSILADPCCRALYRTIKVLKQCVNLGTTLEWRHAEPTSHAKIN